MTGDLTPVGSDRWSSGGAYDAFIGRWSRLVAAEFLAWLAVLPLRRWLDVGCGTGGLTETILARCDPRSVVGMDPSEAFVQNARENVVDARAAFASGSAASTGLGDGSVDVVVSGLVLNFVPDLGEALDEARRVVVPTGTVAGYVWDYVQGMELLRQFWDAAVAIDPAARPHDEAVRFQAVDETSLTGAFRAAGFRAVKARAITVPTVFRDFDDLWSPFLSGTGPAPAYVASLAEPARDALRERLRASVGSEPDGAIRLAARAWAIRGSAPPRRR